LEHPWLNWLAILAMEDFVIDLIVPPSEGLALLGWWVECFVELAHKC